MDENIKKVVLEGYKDLFKSMSVEELLNYKNELNKKGDR